MTEADFIQQIQEAQNIISGIWQYWLASTFAFIVAFHAGRQSITKQLAWIGCVLYLLTSVAATLRYWRIVLFTDQLTSRWLDSGAEPIVLSPILTSGVALISLITFTLGTVAAVWFAIHQHRASNGT